MFGRRSFPSLREFLNNATGRTWTLTVSSSAGKPTLAEQRANDAAALIADVEKHPLVQAVMKTFPGASVEEVRSTGEEAPEEATGEDIAGDD